MKIQDATLMSLAQMIANPDTQIPTGYIGDKAINLSLLSQFMVAGDNLELQFNNSDNGFGSSSSLYYMTGGTRYLNSDAGGFRAGDGTGAGHGATLGPISLVTSYASPTIFTFSGMFAFTDKIGIGTNLNTMGDPAGPFTTQIKGIQFKYTSSATTDFDLGAAFEVEQTVARSGSVQGMEGIVKTSHNSGTVSQVIGVAMNYFMNGTGNVTLVRNAGGNCRAAGTIDEWDLFYAHFANAGGATITKAYHLYGDVYPSGVTNKYGIGIADTDAKSGFGTDAPTAMVDAIGSTTARSSLRIRSGTAPTSPNDGDMWYDGTNVKFRVGGTTKTFTLT